VPWIYSELKPTAAFSWEMVMSGHVPDLPGTEVVFRRDRAERQPLLRRAVIAVVFGGLAAAAGAALGPPMFVIAGVLGLCAAGFAAAFAWEGTFRTVLRPDGIHVRRYVSRVIPWSDVTGFRVHGHGGAQPVQPDLGADPDVRPSGPQLGFRGPVFEHPVNQHNRRPSGRVTVAVVRAHGRHVVLPAPVVSGEQGDSLFTDKVRELEQWRQHYGGAARSQAIG
jgi:hypothetical protein